MSYQVLARKWRPQRFDDVIGQDAVTRTLRNAITSGRIAQAFVFAGSRGCGKTTTARILARALNCEKGPTPDPCGACDACIEIAQGRDIDVLEIDAASHTGIDNIREVVLAGLSISPVRNRYKVFIIDEVHQLSPASFNALLKSIEEPPAHVVFMMATTELHKIPDTILSRAQVFEFRNISNRAITDQLKKIAQAEGITTTDAALALVARSAEGSMRDAQSALDQVIAFAGQQVAVDDVTAVLGLVGRDLLLDIVEAVLDEDGPRAFALADRATESGHDLRLVIRELTGVVRDLMIVSVDPARAAEAEVTEGEQARLTTLAARFSREDLMRAFDVLTKAEVDIKAAAQPRFHFEMALLRWMHTRKLVPLTDLLDQMRGGASAAPAARPALTPPAASSRTPVVTRATPPPAARPVASPAPAAAPQAAAPQSAASQAVAPAVSGRTASAPASRASSGSSSPASAGLKDALLAEIRATKSALYSLAIAQASRIDVTDEKVAFTFAANQRVARGQLEQNIDWIADAVQRLAGRRIPVVVEQSEAAAAPAPAAERAPQPDPAAGGEKRDLKSEAMSSPAVQAMLDVFPGEIRDVEEIQ